MSRYAYERFQDKNSIEVQLRAYVSAVAMDFMNRQKQEDMEKRIEERVLQRVVLRLNDEASPVLIELQKQMENLIK